MSMLVPSDVEFQAVPPLAPITGLPARINLRQRITRNQTRRYFLMQKSPLQNRVTPTGEIIATAYRGSWMGNRGGRLHNDRRQLTAKRWTSKHWICCRLSFQGRQRQVMAANRYTELFFLDEATAFAAGHRPCAECRRSDFNSFIRMWAEIRDRDERIYVREIDNQLHLERLATGKVKRRHEARTHELPDGSFIFHQGHSMLVKGDSLLTWTPAGYTDRISKSSVDRADLLTPPSLVGILQTGFELRIHESSEP